MARKRERSIIKASTAKTQPLFLWVTFMLYSQIDFVLIKIHKNDMHALTFFTVESHAVLIGTQIKIVVI